MQVWSEKLFEVLDREASMPEHLFTKWVCEGNMQRKLWFLYALTFFKKGLRIYSSPTVWWNENSLKKTEVIIFLQQLCGYTDVTRWQIVPENETCSHHAKNKNNTKFSAGHQSWSSCSIISLKLWIHKDAWKNFQLCLWKTLFHQYAYSFISSPSHISPGVFLFSGIWERVGGQFSSL